MASQQLIDYIKTRIAQGTELVEINNTLRLQPGYNENELLDSLDVIVKEKSNAQIDVEKKRNEKFVYILLGVGAALIIFGYSPLNPRGKGAPGLVGLLLIAGSILFYLGPTQVSIWIKKYKEKQKEIQEAKNKRV